MLNDLWMCMKIWSKIRQEAEVTNATQIPIRSKNDILGEHLAHSTHANKLILCVLHLRFRKQTSRKISVKR